MAATRRPALDSAARCPPDAMTSGNCPPWGSVYSYTSDYGDVRSGMRVILEGVEDGKDVLATAAGLGRAILGDVGFRLKDEAGS